MTIKEAVKFYSSKVQEEVKTMAINPCLIPNINESSFSWINTGASKACFEIEDCPYIIKVRAYKGVQWYLEQEYKNYLRSLENGVDFILAPCETFTLYFDDYPWVYEVMERVRVPAFADREDVYTFAQRGDFFSLDDSGFYEYATIIDEIIKCYGRKTLSITGDFFQEYNITDLHPGNYGYNKKGNFVFFDYSGFYGENCSCYYENTCSSYVPSHDLVW